MEYAYLFIKRLFDIIVSLIVIGFLVIVTIFIKIIYLLYGDTKSIFYSQNRVGKNGKLFKMFKFRTMVPNAEEILKEILKDPVFKEEWDQYHKLEKDPRITKAGNFLRKSSLDELPQFINVLFNQMSLVGPRPLTPGELDYHNGDHDIYESVKPGVTSWWASHGRSNTSYKERLELEYFYIRNKSLFLDIKCILATIKGVLYREGAK
ncbi:sugar transferase [Streptococcus sp. FT1-106]|uniref:Initial sugar transferase n=1 Tax=Streptococcus suis TaxID=1307 RepID=M1VRL0_STRSU|nr:initial sugar transferase [Streptococcus suis]